MVVVVHVSKRLSGWPEQIHFSVGDSSRKREEGLALGANLFGILLCTLG